MLSTTHGRKAVWSADGKLDYLGPEHAPLFVVAACCYSAIPVATIHAPPPTRTVDVQVQLSPHHSHDDEAKAISG